jgi:hypothetical protein
MVDDVHRQFGRECRAARGLWLLRNLIGNLG